MALPFAFTDVYYLQPLGGPFKSGTSFYVVAQDASTQSAIKVLKADSDDPSSGWTEQDSTNRPVQGSVLPYASIHTVLDGTTLHVVSQVGTVADIEYHTFNCSTNTWSVTNESVTTAPDSTTTNFCSIAVRSDGDVIVAYNGAVEANMGTDYFRVDLARRESGTWTSDISIENLGKTTTSMAYAFVVMADQTNDRAHIFYHDITGDNLHYSTYLSGNTWGHQHTSADTSTDTVVNRTNSTRAMSFDDAGTTKVRAFYKDASDAVSVVGFDDADSPGSSISIGTDLGAFITASHAFAADGNVQHMLYEHNGDTRFQHMETGAGDDTWGSESIEITGVNEVYSANVYDDVLAYLYYVSPGSYSYNERSLATGATTLTAAAGSYALTGVAAGTAEAHKLTADAGSYALTGVAAGTAQGFLLTADAGSYALTGVDADLLAAYNLTADPGSYALTGVDAGTGAQRRMTAEAGSYALTGVDAALTKQHVIEALAGSYTITGMDAILAQHHVLSADAGSYALTGVDAGTAQGFLMAAEVGSYALTGVAATTTEQHVLEAAVGSYALTGVDAITSKSGADPVLVAEAGSYAITGVAAALTEQHVITAELGTYNLTGVAIGTTEQHVLEAAPGSYSVSGVDAALTKQHVLVAELGTYNLSGVAAALTEQHVLEAVAGSYSLTGVDANTSTSGGSQTLTAEPGSYALTGVAAATIYTAIPGSGLSAPWFRRRRR